jgi:hypothetical protein
MLVVDNYDDSIISLTQKYIDALEDSFDILWEDYGRVYLELWKRVTDKQGVRRPPYSLCKHIYVL